MHKTSENIADAYYVRVVMETGSGFKLNEDSSFQFFYSYGSECGKEFNRLLDETIINIAKDR